MTTATAKQTIGKFGVSNFHAINRTAQYFGRGSAFLVAPNVVAIGDLVLLGYPCLRWSGNGTYEEGIWGGDLEFTDTDADFVAL